MTTLTQLVARPSGSFANPERAGAQTTGVPVQPFAGAQDLPQQRRRCEVMDLVVANMGAECRRGSMGLEWSVDRCAGAEPWDRCLGDPLQMQSMTCTRMECSFISVFSVEVPTGKRKRESSASDVDEWVCSKRSAGGVEGRDWAGCMEDDHEVPQLDQQAVHWPDASEWRSRIGRGGSQGWSPDVQTIPEGSECLREHQQAMQQPKLNLSNLLKAAASYGQTPLLHNWSPSDD